MSALQDIHVLLTGGTDGIGKAAAIELAARGVRLVLVARNPTKAQATLAEIARRTGRQDIEVLAGDLSSLVSVRQVADAYRARFDRLDVLLNNAGIYPAQRQLSPEGFELTLATNYLGPVTLTLELLDLLRASAPARIVITTSQAEVFGKLHIADMQLTHGYTPMTAYAQTKLAGLMFTYDLAQQLAGSGVTVNAFHPGIVRTNIEGMHVNLMMRVMAPFALKAEVPGHKLATLALDPAYAGVTGRYFTNGRELRGSHAAHDVARQDYLRHITAELLQQAPHPQEAEPLRRGQPGGPRGGVMRQS